MTPHADGVRTSAKHRVRWMSDAMIAVTHDASRKRSGFKGLFMRTFFVHLGLESVTVRAHILNPVYSWRRRAMISMAGGTGWRTQIASHRQCLVVNACAVLCELIRGNGISLHVLRVRMAAGAGVRHVNRVDGGTGIAGQPQIVDTVTIRAYCNLGVSSREALAVHTGAVLVQLVGAQAGVELPNICRIRMATSAQLRNLLAINLALPPGLWAHGFVWIVAGWVASVAAGASQTLLCVYVLAELLLGYSQGIRQGGVTIQAGVFGLPITLPATQARCEHDESRQADMGCAQRTELISQDSHKHSYLLRTQEQRRKAQ